jgi:hypothetical protein
LRSSRDTSTIEGTSWTICNHGTAIGFTRAKERSLA